MFFTVIQAIKFYPRTLGRDCNFLDHIIALASPDRDMTVILLCPPSVWVRRLVCTGWFTAAPLWLRSHLDSSRCHKSSLQRRWLLPPFRGSQPLVRGYRPLIRGSWHTHQHPQNDLMDSQLLDKISHPAQVSRFTALFIKSGLWPLAPLPFCGPFLPDKLSALSSCQVPPHLVFPRWIIKYSECLISLRSLGGP